MNEVKRNKMASLLYLIANLFNKGIAFLTVPIFTRLFSVSDYGIVTTYFSWVDIFSTFLSMALYMSIRTFFIDFYKERFDFLNTIICFSTLFSLAMIGFALLVYFFFPNMVVLLIILAVIQGAFNAIIIDCQQHLMMEYKYVERSILMAVPNIVSILLSICVIFYIPLNFKYLGRIVPTLIVHGIFILIILFCLFKNNKPQINKSYLKYGLSISFPLVFHGIALNILSQSDRTMITFLADSAQTGIYSLVYNLSMIAIVLTSSLDGVWVPWFLSHLNEKKYDEINKKAKLYIQLVTVAMIGIMLVGPEILMLLSTKKYWDGIVIIPPVVLSSYVIFAYSLYVNVEHFYKKTWVITKNTFIAALMNIVLNFFLIPKYGYVAAAYTTLISYLIALLLHADFTKVMIKQLFPLKIFRASFICLFVSFIVYYLFLNNFFIRWLLLFVFLTVFFMKYRKELIQ